LSRKAKGTAAGDGGTRRGRPAGLMTGRRRQLLAAHIALAASGERVSVCRLARECGLTTIAMRAASSTICGGWGRCERSGTADPTASSPRQIEGDHAEKEARPRRRSRA
jgi:hypothetical protein